MIKFFIFIILIYNINLIISYNESKKLVNFNSLYFSQLSHQFINEYYNYDIVSTKSDSKDLLQNHSRKQDLKKNIINNINKNKNFRIQNNDAIVNDINNNVNINSISSSKNDINNNIIKKIKTKKLLHDKINNKIYNYYTKLNQINSQLNNMNHTIIIATKLNTIDQLENDLIERSNPRSHLYGKYYTKNELDSIYNNNYITNIQPLIEYFENNNFNLIKKTNYGEILTFQSDINTMENFFNTSFFNFELNSNFNINQENIKIIRATSYSLDENIKNSIIAIYNLVDFPDPELTIERLTESRKLKSSTLTNYFNVSSEIARVYDFVTPQLIYDYYNYDILDDMNKNPEKYSKGSQGVYETIGQYLSPSDLALFQRKFNLPINPISVNRGGHISDEACRIGGGDLCVEGNLDVEYLMTSSGGSIPTHYDYWDGPDFILEWMQMIYQLDDPPKVISISYGADEDLLPPMYSKSFDAVAIKLGLLGITIIVSSGDDGAVSSVVRTNPLLCAYRVSFPATSPYVTSVGGTMGPERNEEEVACQADRGGIITTGGGFSVLNPTPMWQKSSIEKYNNIVSNKSIQSEIPFKGYNKYGRGVPDVSLLARNFIVTIGGNFTVVSGTSASSPLLAGMVSIINSLRLSNGKSTLGWLNPTLYTYSNEFIKDITKGDNKCSAAGRVCCTQGFYAEQGWDPLTGLGSINFKKFKDFLLSIDNLPKSFPSSKPSLVSPTLFPTMPPIINKGWVSIKEFDDENCNGRLTTISSIPANKCFIEYNFINVATGSRQYSCNSDGVIISYFTSSDCNPNKLLVSQKFYSACATRVQDSYYSDSYHSMTLACEENPMDFMDPSKSISDTSPLYPLSLKYDSYAVQYSYDDPTSCINENLSSFDAFIEDHCFVIHNSQVQDQPVDTNPDRILGNSYKIKFPYMILYQGFECNEEYKITNTLLNEECEVFSDNRRLGMDLDNLNWIERILQLYENPIYYGGNVEVNSLWKLYNQTGPTMSPTIMPTSKSLAPTPKLTLPPVFLTSDKPITATPTLNFVPLPTNIPNDLTDLKITFSMAIDGITKNDWKKEINQSNLLLLSTLLKIIPHLSSNYLKLLDYSDLVLIRKNSHNKFTPNHFSSFSENDQMINILEDNDHTHLVLIFDVIIANYLNFFSSEVLCARYAYYMMQQSIISNNINEYLTNDSLWNSNTGLNSLDKSKVKVKESILYHYEKIESYNPSKNKEKMKKNTHIKISSIKNLNRKQTVLLILVLIVGIALICLVGYFIKLLLSNRQNSKENNKKSQRYTQIYDDSTHSSDYLTQNPLHKKKHNKNITSQFFKRNKNNEDNLHTNYNDINDDDNDDEEIIIELRSYSNLTNMEEFVSNSSTKSTSNLIKNVNNYDGEEEKF